MNSGFSHHQVNSWSLPASHGAPPAPGQVPPGEPASPAALREILFFLRMRWQWIVAGCVVTLFLAALQIAFTAPTFIAQTQLMVVPPASGSDAQRASAEDAFVEAQLEIARSSDVLGGAATKLDLAQDPDFSSQKLSLKDKVKLQAKAWLRGAADGSDADAGDGARSSQERKSHAIIARLGDMISLRRIGRSTMIEISASASSPDKAANIANAVAQEYISKNLAMNAQSARQYSDWLETFVKEQKSALAEASNDLINYKSNPRDQFRLAELQSAADARKSLFESTLVKLSDAKQKISYPVPDATIVSLATPPLSEATPRAGLILTFALLLGAGAGTMAAMIRHAGDRRISRPQQVAQATGLSSIVAIERFHAPVDAEGSEPPAANAAPRIGEDGMGKLAALAIALRRRQRVTVGVVSPNPHSGASTVARELAVASARSGATTLLVDIAHPGAQTLTAEFGATGALGLADVAEDASLLPEAVFEIAARLDFLPIGRVADSAPALMMSSRHTEFDLETLKKQYDAVFFDLSALSAFSDAIAVAPEFDGVLMVIDYARTTIDDVDAGIDSLRNAGSEVLGAIINRAPRKTFL
ncbi:polysaccharide biosynthesis tyrosine autokinase [Rhizobium halophytocola]